MFAEVSRPPFWFPLPGVDEQAALLADPCSPARDNREATIVSHYQAVKRVIMEMRRRLDEPLTLQTLAEIACLSPYHFNRVFCRITGIPPGKFLTALRMEAAKHLLLTTQLSVTYVCFEVGYNSLGTFTTHFTQLVGLSPRRLRYLVETNSLHPLQVMDLYRPPADFHTGGGPPGVTGRVVLPGPFSGLIFAGLFPTVIPQSRPVSCALLTAPGPFNFPAVPDGRYYLFVAAFPYSLNLLSYLLPDQAQIWLGSGRSPVTVIGGQASHSIDVLLRSPRLTDPPILIALPCLLVERLAGEGGEPLPA
jgi:AraC-like DNA-binding protein